MTRLRGPRASEPGPTRSGLSAAPDPKRTRSAVTRQFTTGSRAHARIDGDRVFISITHSYKKSGIFAERSVLAHFSGASYPMDSEDSALV